MKQKIIDILLKHSEELNIKGSIMKEPVKEEWVWSGSFEQVAQEIVNLHVIADVSNMFSAEKLKEAYNNKSEQNDSDENN